MANNVTSSNPGQIKPIAGIPVNPCGVDFSNLEKLDGLGKFNKDLFYKSLLDFALNMLPGPMAEIISNDDAIPQELPGIGAMLGAAGMLLSPTDAPQNLQGLWGKISKNCQTGFADTAAGFGPNLSSFEKALANIPPAAVSSDATALVREAYASVKAGASPMDTRIQASLRAACSPFGPGSDAIFAAYDATNLLRATISSLGTPLTQASRIHQAANVALDSVVNIAKFDISQQLMGAGLTGMNLRLDQIHGMTNLSPAAKNSCGPDVLKTLSVMRQTCAAVDDFYGTDKPGFGAIDWDAMTRDLATAVIGSAIKDIANEASGFLPFSPEGILSGVGKSMDSFLSQAMCGGGSDNLAGAMTKDFNKAVDVGLTAVSTVATLYSTASAMTGTFLNTLSVMQSLGSSNAINQMIGGNFSGLFGLASGQITNPKLVLLRQWRDCLAKNKSTDPAVLQDIDERIKTEEAKSNTKWAMTIGQFDANGFFSKTKKLAKALRKVQTAVVQNKPIVIGTTV